MARQRDFATRGRQISRKPRHTSVRARSLSPHRRYSGRKARFAPKRSSGRAVRTPGPVVRSHEPIIKNGFQAAVASMTVAIGVFVSIVVARRSPAAAKSWPYSVSLRSRPPNITIIFRSISGAGPGWPMSPSTCSITPPGRPAAWRVGSSAGCGYRPRRPSRVGYIAAGRDPPRERPRRSRPRPR